VTTNQANPDSEAYLSISRKSRKPPCRKGPAYSADRASQFVAADRVELRTEGAPTAGNLSEKAMRGNLTGDEPGSRPEHRPWSACAQNLDHFGAADFFVLVARTHTLCIGGNRCIASPVRTRTQALGMCQRECDHAGSPDPIKVSPGDMHRGSRPEGRPAWFGVFHPSHPCGSESID
jgi:hypothetical protein